MPALAALLDDLVAANRILAGLSVLDGFGHVSARHPEQPDRYLLSRSLAPELVTRADIMTFDLASAPGNDTRPPYLERFIHGEIYAKRPDVNAVVHSHSAAVVPFAASSVRLRPIFHMSGFLRDDGVVVFEMRQRFGMTDLLVRRGEQGVELAQTLADDNVVLMRGHGFCAVGDSIPVAVYCAYYTQTNAALQQQAVALGGSVKYLADEEARLADETNRRVINRPWELWRTKYASRSGS